MIFQPTDKMCDLMCRPKVSEHGFSLREELVLQLTNRFGISMGVGEQSIQEVCALHGVNCDTFLTIVNYALNKVIPSSIDVDIPTLHRYLENAHTYFLRFQLPRIRQELLEAVNLAQVNNQVPLMIIQFFDEYAQEIKTHIDHESEHSYEQHARDDQHIANKANELKTLIVKYFPTPQKQTHADQMRLLYAALHDLRHFEDELALHCAIEDNIMLPALRKVATQQRASKPLTTNKEDCLTTREIEILRQVALGLSNKEIADTLFLSTHTVMSHRKNIARKLDIHSTAGLTIYAVVNGIVDINSIH
jgi:regulator of cell morphogenesis and NO signaling